MSHLLPDYSFLNTQIPKIKMPDLPTHYMWSSTQFEIIKRHIQQYEKSLDSEHEVGVMLTNFGQSVLMQVTEVSYEESVVLIFRGYVNGKMSTLIQHINQLNFLLTSMEKEPEKPKRRIGFISPSEK
jgi:hypothetical protein